MFWSEIQEPWSDLGCVKYRLRYSGLEVTYIRLLSIGIYYCHFFLNSRTPVDLETKMRVRDFVLVEYSGLLAKFVSLRVIRLSLFTRNIPISQSIFNF